MSDPAPKFGSPKIPRSKHHVTTLFIKLMVPTNRIESKRMDQSLFMCLKYATDYLHALRFSRFRERTWKKSFHCSCPVDFVVAEKLAQVSESHLVLPIFFGAENVDHEVGKKFTFQVLYLSLVLHFNVIQIPILVHMVRIGYAIVDVARQANGPVSARLPTAMAKKTLSSMYLPQMKRRMISSFEARDNTKALDTSESSDAIAHDNIPVLPSQQHLHTMREHLWRDFETNAEKRIQLYSVTRSICTKNSMLDCYYSSCQQQSCQDLSTNPLLFHDHSI